MRVAQDLNPDELQAIVAGLAGVALEAGNDTGFELVGRPPCFESGHWREGFIANPLPGLELNMSEQQTIIIKQPPAASLKPGTFFRGLLIHSKLGEGGMGAAYLARSSLINTP